MDTRSEQLTLALTPANNGDSGPSTPQSTTEYINTVQTRLSPSPLRPSHQAHNPQITEIKPTKVRIGNIQEIPQFRKGISRTYSKERVDIKDFIKETQPRFQSVREQEAGTTNSQKMIDPNLTHLVPAPLTARSSPKKEPTSPKTKRASLLAEARDSMSWGVQELTGGPVVRSKEPTIPENFAVPPPTSTRKRTLASGKNPLKSPFPLRKNFANSTESQESDSTLGNRFSGAMKRLSGGKSPTKTTVISNSARAPDGPDTPMPVKAGGVKSTFPSVNMGESVQHGNEVLQEVYLRAKKSLKIKTSEEKRRESLKKKIVVVGVTDQSPGMFLSAKYMYSIELARKY
jgi:hypothetical protein